MIQISSPYGNAVLTNEVNALEDIHLTAKNIVVYQREIASLNKELNQIAKQRIECRATGTTAEILSLLKDYFNHNLSQCNTLYDDISQLVKLFEKTTKAGSFRLLLATVDTNMCSKFHTDINDLRLLCTYIGPGTLWLPDEAIDFKALQKRGGSQEIVKNPQLIQQVQTGDVVLLKGALYPDAKPILHRSPAIEERGENRLLLRLDTNEFLNF